MTGIEIVLLYSVGGSIAFIATLKIFKVEFAIWEPILACIAAAAAAMFIPTIGNGIGSLVAMLLVFKLINKSSWEDIWLPVVAARLALIPIAMAFTL
jgi:hypothetical protein